MKAKIFLILLLSILFPGPCSPGPRPGREKVLSQMIGNWLANWHYSGKKIDDDFSAKGFAQYTKYLDNGKNFLIQADLEASRPMPMKVDDGLLQGDFSLPRLGRQLLRQRVLQVQGFAREIWPSLSISPWTSRSSSIPTSARPAATWPNCGPGGANG